MADELPDDRQLEHPEVGFEPTDISLRGVLVAIVVFAGVILLHQFITLKLFEYDRRQPANSREAGFATVTRETTLPREPRLEQVDRLAGVRTPDVYRREQDKEAILRSYGPTDEKGFVHVPIDWAIKQAVEQIPSRSEKPATPTRNRGLINAGESNSGRVFRGERAP